MSLISWPYFALVLSVVFLVGLLPRQRYNLLLLASLVFYGTWHWSFPLLLIFLASVNYLVSKRLLIRPSVLLLRSLIIFDVAFLVFSRLGFFGANIFRDSTASGFDFYQVAIPVGASFYTLQMISTAIEAQQNRIKRKFNFRDYFLYICFFPKLLAGPIEQYDGFFAESFTTEKEESFQLILFGVFKKVVIAGLLAPFVDAVFTRPSGFSGAALLLGAVCFRYQLYADFSGYIDIARGSARLLGFNLRENFRSPYLSTSLTEHWRRWHATLGGWFREYIFFPLAYRAKSPAWIYINLLIVFALIGIWHGLAGRYLIWGLLNGAILSGELLVERFWPGFVATKNLQVKVLRVGTTFSCVALTAILIRAHSLSDSMYIFSRLAPLHIEEVPRLFLKENSFFSVLFALPMIAVWEGLHIYFKRESARKFIQMQSGFMRILLYIITIGLIAAWGNFHEGRFIYFQF